MHVERRVGHLLRRCHQVENAIWIARLGPSLTAPQYAVLAIVREMGIADQQSVGQVAALDSSTVADIARRLEARRWLRTEEHPSDGRRRMLTVTADAEVLLNERAEEVAAVQRDLVVPVPRSQHSKLYRQLRLAAGLGRSLEPPIPGTANIWGQLMETPGHLLRRLQQTHTALWQQEVGGGVTGPQYAVLWMLHSRGPQSQRQLGALAALDRSTLSEILRRMDRRGVTRRMPAAADRRSRVVEITYAGEQLLRHNAQGVERVQQSLLLPISARERAGFVGALSRVALGGGQIRGEPQGSPRTVCAAGL